MASSLSSFMARGARRASLSCKERPRRRWTGRGLNCPGRGVVARAMSGWTNQETFGNCTRWAVQAAATTTMTTTTAVRPFTTLSFCTTPVTTNQQRRLDKYSLYTSSLTTRTSLVVPVVVRHFQTESAYHQVADETLEDIQDAIDVLLEDVLQQNNDGEATFASGVLTVRFPPHGTWVLNKQTPNRQIWWSSPLSGPRRYEYDEPNQQWVYTRSSSTGQEGDGDSGMDTQQDSAVVTLGDTLREEVKELYGVDLELDVK